MTRYWVVGLIVALLALIYLVRRSRKRTAASESSADLPLKLEQYGPAPMPDEAEEDDTAPSVLSPPELNPPKYPSR
jgi:hypothetical protein